MKYLVDDVLRTTESTTVCYFFFKDDFEDQRSASSALCCILYQLFHHREIVLSNKIAERFETNGEHITSSFVELWDILITASRDENAGEIVCVLDAFDECKDQGQSEFTRYLTKLYSTGNNFNLKFLLTSRPYGNIRRGFQPLDIPELPVIHLSGESETEMIKIVQEIDIYIKVRVHSIGERLRLKPDEEALLLREILRIPNRTYLWASLTLNIVENDVNIVDTGILEVTSRLPRSVDEAYERILSKSTDVEEARKLLQIVIAAARPLTLYEMNLALALQESHRSHEGLNLASEERFSEYVRDICGLFVTVIDSRLYLLHQTAREFLVQTSSVGPRKSYRNRFKWKSLLRIDKSHGLLSRICIWYLLLVELNHASLGTQDPNGNTSGYWQRHYKFLNYSAMNWALHFRKSHVDDSALTESLKEICDVGSMRCKLWFSIYWETTHGEPPPYFTTIMIASYFGLGRLVKLLLRNSREIRSQDEKYMRTALSWASENGFLDVVNLLTKRHKVRFKDIVRLSFSKPQRGVGIEERDRYGRTPLSYAARQGHTAVARLLVKKGARVDSKDHIGGTPISYALCNENQELSRLLLQEGHTVNSVREILEPLLLSAIRRGDRATVKLILDSNKVNTKQGNTEGGRLLSEAVRSGHGPVVKVLLESTKVNANWGNTDGDALLLEAVRSGNAPVVKALLESTKASADRDALLFKVVKRDHYNAVKLLLESGKVNPNSKDDYGMTPLAWAAKEGHGPIVELLLEIGKVNPKGRDNNGLTALSWAFKNGHDSIAKRLKLAIIDYNKG
ncbi:hypothetical protein NUW58_g2262 [Xylaria curta]|uniref:Uncharacterized protein n=1 Tax=Xylaria curta TaxID=42375 RepID=A0ACC1PGE2_9PEZI|nr:hypothetical protein NUW58_g2262 [Xylaria curta]